MKSRRQRFGLLIAAAVLAFAPAGVDAAPARRPAPSGRVAATAQVKLQVPVVYATESHKRVDPRLAKLKLTRYLAHLRYTGFELLGTHELNLSARNAQSFTIDGGRKVTVELLSRDENRARMRVQITSGRNGKLLDTTLSVNRNGTFIVAGPRYKDGILVLPLTARY